MRPWTGAHVAFPDIVSVIVGTLRFALGLVGVLARADPDNGRRALAPRRIASVLTTPDSLPPGTTAEAQHRSLESRR